MAILRPKIRIDGADKIFNLFSIFDRPPPKKGIARGLEEGALCQKIKIEKIFKTTPYRFFPRFAGERRSQVPAGGSPLTLPPRS